MILSDQLGTDNAGMNGGPSTPGLIPPHGSNGVPGPVASGNGHAALAEPWPANVMGQHQRELTASGITPAVARSAGVYSCTDPVRVTEILKWNNKSGTAPKAIRGMGPSIVFPFFDAAGKLIPDYARVKPERPRERKGKVVKYESPQKEPNRAYFCPGSGPAIADPTRPLLFTEGEKKALCATLHGFPAIGLIGVYGFAKKREDKSKPFQFIPELEAIPLERRPVYVCYDSDIPDKIEAGYAEWQLCETLRAKGADVKVVRLPNGPPGPDGKPAKMGLDDFLVGHGPAALQELIDEAIEPAPPRDPRPKVIWGVDEYRSTREVIRALAKDPGIYQRGNALVRASTEATAPESVKESAGPRIEVLSLPYLQMRITEHCRIVKRENKDGRLVEYRIHPPAPLVKQVADAGAYESIRPLEGIVQAPVLFADGRVLQTPGYDRRSGLLYIPCGDYPVVPTSVSREQAVKAAKPLLYVVKDFPFFKPAHKSAWFAGLLTMAGRYAFKGNAPLFLCDANTRGSGKGLLIDCACAIALGHAAGKNANVTKDEEMTKLILSIVRAGDRAAVLDNIGGVFGTPALDAALTAPTFKGRLLCTNDNVEFPMTVTFWASGNNVVCQGDTARRIAHIRLDSRLENPEDRDDVTEKELLAYVHREKARLLCCALTILSGFIQAGRPKHNLKPWGSFEQWSALIRECVVWLGMEDLPDPGLARIGREPGADKDTDALRGLLAVWENVDPSGAGMTVAELLRRLKAKPEGYAVARAVLTDLLGAEEKSWSKVAYKLRSFSGRTVGGKFFDCSGGQGGVKSWKVCSASAATTLRAGGDGGDGGDVLGHHAGAGAGARARENVEGLKTSPPSPPSPPSDDSIDDLGLDPWSREPGQEG
jgi:hypothetical protein